MGRLCQTGYGGPKTCASLSRPLHPSCCHQQSPARLFLWGASHFPLEGLWTRKQAATHDALGIGVLTPLRATCSSTRLRPHSPVWIPCQPAPFQEPCSDSSVACFRRAIAGTILGHSFRGEMAMSSLRPLDADRLQTDRPPILLTMRTARYFLKRSITIRAIPCVHARSHSCVSGDHCHFRNRPSAAFCRLPSVILKPAQHSEATFRRTPKLAASWKSTNRRLNLHTRRAPSPASF